MAEVLTPGTEIEQPVVPEVLVAVPVPPSPTLTKYRRAILFVAPVTAILLSWGSAVGLHFMMTNEEPVQAVAVVDRGPPNGSLLYAQHCAQCHGDRGNGVGISPLTPPARHFGADKFKFATTSNGVPIDEDLLHILRRGIPGSAMPAFAQLSEEELRAIIGHVRQLTWNNKFAVLSAKELKEVGEYDPLDVAERTDKQTTPGQPLEIPTKYSDANPELLTQGHKVYMQNCAPCHGPEGRGDGPQVHKNENGTLARPRDLTQGLYKGGSEPEHLYARIVLGIPGTPMPATNRLSPQEVDALIAYIRSLSGPGQNGAVAVQGR